MAHVSQAVPATAHDEGATPPAASLGAPIPIDTRTPSHGRLHFVRRISGGIAAFYDLDSGTPLARRLPALDGVRGLACLQIISGAFRINGFKALGAGLFGVDAFFVLSGFVLFLPWGAARMRGAPPPDRGRYYRRRARRIVPAYYFMLFFLIVFFVPAHIAPSMVYSLSGFFALITHLSFQQAIIM